MGFIDRPQSLWWRKAVFQIHLWTGVIIGLYVIVISISGSILVFERDLMDHRPRLAGPARAAQTDYTALVGAAQKAFPGEALASVDMRTRERRVVTVILKAGNQYQRTVYLDANTNQVVGNYLQQQRHPFLVWLESFHNELAGGRNGELLNGIGGALLALLCITGIVIWWPGIKTWPRALRVQWRARWVRINYDLHSAVGFWALLFVTMWGATGAYFIFPQQVQKVFGLFENQKPSRSSGWKPEQPLLPTGTYVDTAKRTVGGADLAFLYMDVFRPDGQVTAFLSRDPAVPLTLLEDIIRMDPANGNVLQIESSRRWSFGEKLLMATYSIHFGDFGGNSSKALWAVLGLTPALLAVSGYLMWWNRYLSKKWRELFLSQSVGAR